MTSRTTEPFRQALAALPEQVRRQAKAAYRLFQQNPQHPGLRFRLVHPNLPIYSARISRDYRAVGVREDETILWFWIGTHAEYDHLLTRL